MQLLILTQIIGEDVEGGRFINYLKGALNAEKALIEPPGTR